ncbi:MAG: metallophosphoesterase, partial [Xanthomonadales bacterium]|nr:metallophosphoesterase [Xanthomonadales bacterium]
DYDHYIEVLRMADLVNRRGRWAGGTAHLVQTGDIPDRGPETRRIMDHIDKLAEQAEKAGGRVHRLIGNHEAMNLYGDLRYVTNEEFEEFAGRNSEAFLDRYYDLLMQDVQQNDPEAFASLPEDHRQEWEATHPPGFVEHRQAWDPAWNPEGEYVQRTLGLKIAVRINGNLFVHGGISDLYADHSLAELTEQARRELAEFNYADPGMVEEACGPLWFRGLAGDAPKVSPELLDSILERMSASRIVVGHTPTPGIVWPRYDGRVIQIDTGISAHYGGHPAYLEITADGVFAGYPGGKLPVPLKDAEREDYLERVVALDPDNSRVKQMAKILLNEAEVQPAEAEAETPGTEAPQGDDGADTNSEDSANASAGDTVEDGPDLCLRDASAAAL